MPAPAPVETVAALADQIARAHAHGSPQRIIGAGTWLDAGRPITGEPLSLATLGGIVEYVPGDLTLTARAGTSLAELDAVTAAEGQWLGLDPVSDPRGTIGATVATASDGPLSLAHGRVRDLVLGLEVITGRGEITRAGGRVVKNVAGFDLVRLHTGAWGTLGVITEVSIRLRARPPIDGTVAISFDDARPLASVLGRLAEVSLAPLALVLLNAPRAAELGLPATSTVLVRLGGNHARVDAQRTALSAIGDAVPVDTTCWNTLALPEPATCSAARITHEPARLAHTWQHVREQCAAHAVTEARLVALPARGLVRVVFDSNTTAALDWSSFTRTIAPPGAHVTWERLPAHAWPHVPCPTTDRLSRGLRAAFDPAHVLNRGIFGETTAPVTHTASLVEPR